MNNGLVKEMKKVVLSGGPSLFPEMQERIHNELKTLSPHVALKVSISLSPFKNNLKSAAQ